MGFEAPTYKLVWPADSRWSGLEVRLRGQTIGELEEVTKLQGSEYVGIDRVMPVLDLLGKALISWNLESGGEQVEVSSFREQDTQMLLAIVQAWTEIGGDIPKDSPPISADGKRSEEESMPMEIPSASRPNLSTPN